MTKEQINIAIAQACGIDIEKYVMEEGGINTSALPDYCNDLNAMHEAEKTLDDDHLYIYGNKLDRITLPKTSMEMCYIEGPEAGMYPDLFCATAAQRAEAFLKTIEKWNSNKI